jgi:metal-responsive CopG/Arc/MetJ family transcriptional regulator
MTKERNHGRGKDATQISFSLPQELSGRLNAYAAKEKRNRSNMIVYLLSNALDAAEKHDLIHVCPASGRGQKSVKAS